MLRNVLILLVLCCAAGFPLIMLAQNDAAASKQAEGSVEDQAADVFKVPEGTDSETLTMYLIRLQQSQPQERTPEEVRKHLQKMDQSLAELLNRDFNEDLYFTTAEFRYRVIEALDRFKDSTAEASKTALFEKLKQDKRGAAKTLLTKLELLERSGRLPTLSQEERGKLIDEIASLIQSAEKLDSSILEMAMESARFFEIEDSAQAAKAYAAYRDALKFRNDPRLVGLVEMMEATLKRAPGQLIEVTGTTVDGKPFNLDEYKGKVVLVDFWATWCLPCLQEMPNLKELYQAYHSKGFEIVGVSVDHDRERLKSFLADQDIPWVNLFSDSSGEDGSANKIGEQFGVTAYPTMLLVGTDGKVSHMNARGENLSVELEKLLGPPEKPIAPPLPKKRGS